MSSEGKEDNAESSLLAIETLSQTNDPHMVCALGSNILWFKHKIRPVTNMLNDLSNFRDVIFFYSDHLLGKVWLNFYKDLHLNWNLYHPYFIFIFFVGGGGGGIKSLKCCLCVDGRGAIHCFSIHQCAQTHYLRNSMRNCFIGCCAWRKKFNRLDAKSFKTSGKQIHYCGKDYTKYAEPLTWHVGHS